jgi:hypothetical protein
MQTGVNDIARGHEGQTEPYVHQHSSLARSMLASAPLVLALAAILACADNFADPDLWMHILVGRVILTTGRIPARDLYSYSAAGLPWRNHEWLAQVALALSYGAGGIVGLKLLKLICAAVVVLALAAGLSRTCSSAGVQRMVLLASAAGIMVQMQFRPQLFTFALLSVELAVLAREVYQRQGRLWPLIPIFGLWANLHGGFVVGLGSLGICASAVALQELRAGRTIERGVRLAVVTAGCALATLLNPYGIGLWRGVIHSVSDPVIRAYINDWVPLPVMLSYLWQHSRIELFPFALPLALFAVFAASIVIAPLSDDLGLSTIALIFMVAAFWCCRNTELAVIAISIPLAHHAELARQRIRQDRKRSYEAGRLVMQSRYISAAHSLHADGPPHHAMVAGGALLLAFAGGIFSNHLVTWEPVPLGAVAFMKARGLHGNILNNYDWGEYLVWQTTPQSRVFVDTRCELVYPDRLLNEYLAFLYGRPGGERLLDRYPHDFVLAKVGTGAYRLTARDSRWKLIYHDSISALFARSSAPLPDHDQVSMSGAGNDSSFP